MLEGNAVYPRIQEGTKSQNIYKQSFRKEKENMVSEKENALSQSFLGTCHLHQHHCKNLTYSPPTPHSKVPSTPYLKYMSSWYPVALHLINEQSYLIHFSGMTLISTNLVVTHKCCITLFYSNQINLTPALHLIRAMHCLHSVTLKWYFILQEAHTYMPLTYHSCYRYLPFLRWHHQRDLSCLQSSVTSMIN